MKEIFVNSKGKPIIKVISGDVIKVYSLEEWQDKQGISKGNIEKEEADSKDYASMSYIELKKECSLKGIKATGKKGDLLDKLENTH